LPALWGFLLKSGFHSLKCCLFPAQFINAVLAQWLNLQSVFTELFCSHSGSKICRLQHVLFECAGWFQRIFIAVFYLAI
jgi:hypothetical protein